MKFEINTNYPSIAHLQKKAERRMPKFAYDYLIEGCNEDLNVSKNTSDLKKVELMPQYFADYQPASTKKTLFGKTYDAPIGITAVGLQSLMWPKTAEYLAKTSVKHNLPFMLSTVTTLSIEEAAKITNGEFWFQLYHPAKQEITDDLLKRAADNGSDVLVLLSDVPTFGYRPRDIYNGLGMPPKMMLRNILEVCTKPQWAIETLLNGGMPSFKTMEKYMPQGMDLKQLGVFMDETFNGRLTVDKIKALQDKWDGKIVIKGISSVEDAQIAADLGIDGIIVSNHGGRQLDAGPSTIKTLPSIADAVGDKMTVMMDSGMRTGPDVARAIASGAEFAFMGRPFMYGTGALGAAGGDQAASILKREFQQVMEQVCCSTVDELPNFLLK
ncbi:MAG: alpha-hydroxy-acid oxidizing protein [Gammaproteobacteria bacterium]|nr:alpha-hydroxy-acid oxidizing protein [Gammaproteobacteria bacterium]